MRMPTMSFPRLAARLLRLGRWFFAFTKGRCLTFSSALLSLKLGFQLCDTGQ